MKAIINGFRYDTAAAVEIGSYDNVSDGATSRSDFNFWQATLYKTPKAGRFFLHGEGGPMSRFSRRIDGNSFSGGERIEPLSTEEAYKWAEQYLDAETVEQVFPDQVTDA